MKKWMSLLLIASLLLSGTALAQTAPPAGESPAEEPTAGEEPASPQPGAAEQPTDEDALLDEPVAEDPGGEDPVAEDPVGEDPVAEDPVAEDPVAEDPVAEDPVAEDPVAEDPVAEDPVAEDPIAEDPVAEDPAAGEPIVYDAIEVEDEAPKHKTIKSWLDAQPRKKKGAIKGALKGAGAGLLAALVRGKNPLAGAAIGAAAGALVGFLIGKRKDKVFAARDAAVAEIGYEPSQGYVMRIQELRFDPPNLQPGESGAMHARYVVVGPDPDEKIVVQAYMGLKYDESYVTGKGPDKLVVRKGGGIIETVVPVTIPEDAPAGTYTVESMFDDPFGKFAEQREQSPLYVHAPETEEAAAT